MSSALEVSELVDSIELSIHLTHELVTDLPSIQRWQAEVIMNHWDEPDPPNEHRRETIGSIDIVKGSLDRGNLWDELDAIEGDLEAVGSSLLSRDDGCLKGEVEERIAGIGEFLIILNSVKLDEGWRGHGVGPLVVGEALLALGGDASCFALYPAPLDDSKGAARSRATKKLEQVWAKLGFERFDERTWILDASVLTLQNSVDELRESFGLTRR